MKIPKNVVTLVVALTGWSLTPAALAAVTIDIGSGPDTSHFVLESPNVGTRIYHIHYGSGGAPAPADAYDLFTSILGADATITATVFNYGTAVDPNHIVNDISFGGSTEVNTAAVPYSPSWTHWVSGAEAGYPSASPIADGIWINGSGLSDPYRLVGPGSWDALVYSDYVTQPSIAPVPEPAGTALLGLALVALGLQRRRLGT